MKKFDLVPKIPNKGMAVINYHSQLPPYLAYLTFGWKNKKGRELAASRKVKMLKAYPGVTYMPKIGRHVWQVANEATEWIQEACGYLQYDLYDLRKERQPPEVKFNEKDLFPFQSKHIGLPVEQNAFLAAFDMGLGKTVFAIRALEHLNRILVVCPKAILAQWRDKISAWGTENYSVFVRQKITDPWPSNGWIITSYNTIQRDLGKFDALVFDESHFLKNPKAERTKISLSIKQDNKEAVTLLLTGTPIADQPKDLWMQLELMFPGRFGSQFAFNSRYSGKIPQAYARSGYEFKGLNTDNVDELKDRLAPILARVTKDEVAHLLPPITIDAVRITPDEPIDICDWADKEDYKSWCNNVSDKKIESVYTWVKTALQTERNILVFTYLRKTAHLLGDRLAATVITGEHDNRNERIEEALKNPGAIVATISSVGTGVDSLANVGNLVFCELPWYPVEALQAIARGHRLTTTSAVTVTIFIFVATGEERIAHAIAEKRLVACKVIEGGDVEKQLEKALNLDLEDWESHMSSVVSSSVDDLYLPFLT